MQQTNSRPQGPISYFEPFILKGDPKVNSVNRECKCAPIHVEEDSKDPLPFKNLAILLALRIGVMT